MHRVFHCVLAGCGFKKMSHFTVALTVHNSYISLSSFQVSSIISQFLLGPEAATSFLINDNVVSSEPRAPRIRLSNSSPAMLGAMHCSNGNLNSLADAFLQYGEAEKTEKSPKVIKDCSSKNYHEPLRRYIASDITVSVLLNDSKSIRQPMGVSQVQQLVNHMNGQSLIGA